jgi:hypothetical protein
MKYLIVKPQSVNAGGRHNLTEIRLVDESARVNHDVCEVWAIRTGNQMLDVYGQLIRKMKNFHMAGNLDNGAVYVMDYSDTVMVVTSMLGESDRARYQQMETMRAGHMRHVAAAREAEFGQFIGDLFGGIMGLMWTVLRGIGSVIFKVLLALLFARWLRRRR